MIFSVEIDLTDKGVSSWNQVARTVFQYLEMLRQYPQGGLPAYLHEERKQIAQMSFQFMQEKDRGSSAPGLCSKHWQKKCKNCLFFIQKSVCLCTELLRRRIHLIWSLT